MTSRLLNDAHRYMLRCLSTHEAVHHCTVFTSISEVLIRLFISFLPGEVRRDIYIGIFIYFMVQS